MYGKLFASMFDGTLAMKGPWQALVTFQQLVILSDKDGVVDMTAEALSRRTTIPLDVIQVGLSALEQPDPESRTPDEDGRRIVRLSDGRSWGWRITNYAKYREIRSADERRDYHRQYWHKRQRRQDSSATQQTQRNSTNSTKAVSSKQKQGTTTTTSPESDEHGEEPTARRAPPGDIERVLAHYCAAHPRRRPGDKDRGAVARALKRGYSEAELCLAIDGNSGDSWHRDKHKHELSYVLSDNGKIDTFIAKAAPASRPLVQDGWMSEQLERDTRPPRVAS